MPEPVFPHTASATVKARRDKLVAIVKANPGITRTQIGKKYFEVEKLNSTQSKSISNMILNCCLAQRIKHIEIDKYE
jgi:hypothetical protein